jgi:hypothetical protein
MMTVDEANTYWTVATLLTEVTLPGLVLNFLCLLEFADTSIHALGHVVATSALGNWDIQELDLKLADTVGRSSNYTTPLTLDTAHARVVDGPLVEAGNVNNQRTTVCCILVVVQTHIGACEGTILPNQIVEQIPSSRLLVALGRCLRFLLFLQGQAISLLLGLSLIVLALLGRHKEVAESGSR